MYNNMQMNPHESQGDYQPDQIKGLCKQYMSYHVIGQLSDGSQVDGIIDSMDEEGVTMLVPEEVDEEQMNRQFDYGYDYNYGRPRRRFRRFRRQRFPFRFFRSLFRYPYYYPPYPWYGYGGGFY
ncbi:hypothetical protein SAMN05216232_2595 [Virgibacillus subterraneus]|uniref:Uncharacterized protein n=1 Tax=Virgibacillus subterraneus TaxID=621109 RepID=A0A1H9GG31_9BACI|nr:hypothetical protein [Virgibacillus subterraneus]SEQ49009.1 hypothetical protein SAMN05216232_2595 [Virgibacillus subterraneus]